MNRLTPLALLGSLLLAGCGGKEEDEGPLMAPGQDCLACHAFAAAGTVFASATSAQGVAGATVVLRSPGTGAVLASLTTNAAGNFYTSAALPSSFDIEVTSGGQTRTMTAGSRTVRACNGCHDASFRVHVP